MADRATVKRGDVFGRWTVLDPGASGERMLVRCACGTEAWHHRGNIRSGRSTSCGCSRSERRVRSRPEYGSWYMMIYRCTVPSAPDYPRYGGAGITVCERWLDFDAFLADMGPRPPGTTIDRINGSKGYEPRNVRWASSKQQAWNRTRGSRVPRFYERDGERLPIREWAKRLGIGDSTVRERLRRGWSIERALSTPADAGRCSPRRPARTPIAS